MTKKIITILKKGKCGTFVCHVVYTKAIRTVPVQGLITHTNDRSMRICFLCLSLPLPFLGEPGAETVPPPTTLTSATSTILQPSSSLPAIDNQAFTGGKSTSKVPVIAGVVVAVVVLIFLVLAFWMYRRRKNRR